MGTMPHTGTYGSATVVGNAWVNMDEDELSAVAQSFEALASYLTGVVAPQLRGQQAANQAIWTGGGSQAASNEASAIINGHEMNAKQASSIANKLRQMENVIARTKGLLNQTAEQVENECQNLAGMPLGMGESGIAAVIAQGLAQNMTEVTAATSQLGDGLGVSTSGLPGMVPSDPQGAMQMFSQVAQQVGKVPQQLGKMAGGGGGGQGLQQMMQPMQQLMSMFGKGGGSGSSPFSNHPALGGSGPKAGAGLVRGGGGGGGGGGRSPMMANLVGKSTVAVSTAPPMAGAASASRMVGGTAPVGAGGTGSGAGGTGGMMGNRGATGGSRVAMAAPAPLQHDFGDDEGDDDW